MKLQTIVTVIAALVWGVVLPSDDSRAQQPESTQSSVVVSVTGSDGNPETSPYLNLWRAIEAGEPEPKNTVNGDSGFGYYDPVIWHQRSTGMRFVRIRNAYPNDGRHSKTGEQLFRFESLAAGTYFITAVRYRSKTSPADPTPFGFSKPFLLDGSQSIKTNIELGPGEASLTLKTINKDTRHPIRGLAVRLRTESGIPIVHGYGSGNFFERSSTEGTVNYGSLPKGKYLVELIGKQAGVGERVEYLPTKELVAVDVRAETSDLEIPVSPTNLDDAEFATRNPFQAFGQVVDPDGTPIANATVRVATGVGTLLGGGTTTTDKNGKFHLYFSPGTMMNTSESSPLGVGIQAAQFYVKKEGWRLDHNDESLFYLMTDLTPEGFESLLKSHGRVYWSKTDTSEVVFAHSPKEINFVLTKGN